MMNCLELPEKLENHLSVFELFNEMNDGIVIQEINGRCVWANEAMGEIIGIPHPMIVGMDVIEFFNTYFSPVQQNRNVFINLLRNTFDHNLALNNVLCSLKVTPNRLFEYSTRIMTTQMTCGLRMNIFRVNAGSAPAAVDGRIRSFGLETEETAPLRP